jgi:hypothetical protein
VRIRESGMIVHVLATRSGQSRATRERPGGSANRGKWLTSMGRSFPPPTRAGRRRSRSCRRRVPPPVACRPAGSRGCGRLVGAEVDHKAGSPRERRGGWLYPTTQEPAQLSRPTGRRTTRPSRSGRIRGSHVRRRRKERGPHIPTQPQHTPSRRRSCRAAENSRTSGTLITDVPGRPESTGRPAKTSSSPELVAAWSSERSILSGASGATQSFQSGPRDRARRRSKKRGSIDQRDVAVVDGRDGRPRRRAIGISAATHRQPPRCQSDRVALAWKAMRRQWTLIDRRPPRKSPTRRPSCATCSFSSSSPRLQLIQAGDAWAPV